MPGARNTAEDHISELLNVLLSLDVGMLSRWGSCLSAVLPAGHRLLVAGNGGSAAQAGHLVAELVGKFQSDRLPLSAISLASDPAVLSALGNDFGIAEIFARQVQAHGRRGDILLLLSTSGRSQNLLRAVSWARRLGLLTWALTGAAPNKLEGLVDEAFCVDSSSAQSVQECHLVAIHALCALVDEALVSEHASSPGQPVEASAAVRLTPARRVAAEDPAPRQPNGPLVVCGDAFLDRDIAGSAGRLSPEAPVPVVDSAVALDRPGGAALAAALAARRPGETVLITCLGSDSRADQLRAMLQAAGVRLIDVGTSSTTMVKTRVRTADRTLLRYDTGPASSEPLALTSEGLDALESAAAILVADYGRGMSADERIRTVLEATAARVPVVWDPHPRGGPPVPGTRLACPSGEDACQLVPDAAGNGLAGDVMRAHRLRQAWAVQHVCITRGAAGAVLVDSDDGLPKVVPAPRIPVADPCGAGDQFAVTAAHWLGCGALPSEAVNAAVAEATDFLFSGGVSSWRSGQDRRAADNSGAGFEIARQVRNSGGTVVVAGGCFDLLHAGHVALLERARSLGDCLIVCLNSDTSVRRIKGPDRPVVPAVDRK